MSTRISLQFYAHSKMMGMRASADPIRGHAEELLDAGSEVIFDFTGVAATQSFIDELVGALVIRYGPSILERLVFKGCSSDVRAILRFVTADRAAQFHEGANSRLHTTRKSFGSMPAHACA